MVGEFEMRLKKNKNAPTALIPLRSLIVSDVL